MNEDEIIARKKFTCKAMSLFIFYIILSAAQWCVLFSKVVTKVFSSYAIVCFIMFSLFLLLFGSFAFIERVRHIPILHFFLEFLIVETLIWSLIPFLLVACVEAIAITIPVALVTILLSAVIGRFLPFDISKRIGTIFTISFLLLFEAMYLIWTYLTTSNIIVQYCFVALTVLVICLFTIHHIQTFNGMRFAELRSTDFYFAAIILYVLFVAVFLPYLYVISTAWANTEELLCSKVVAPNVLRSMKSNLENIVGMEKHDIREHNEGDISDWGLLPNWPPVDDPEIPNKLKVKR